MEHKVTVFSTPTCPWCVRARDYLNANKIAFEDIDISQDQAAATTMVQKSGEIGVPQLWIDDDVVVGFDQATIDHLLGL